MKSTAKFGVNTKFRVIINRVSVYTTKRQIVTGIGDFMSINAAAQGALMALEHLKSEACGLCGDWSGHQVQIDLAVF